MTESITIRHSSETDRERLVELAALDSRRAPEGDVLVAEVDGSLWAAFGVSDGTTVADPFRPSREVVGLLRRAAELERAA